MSDTWKYLLIPELAVTWVNLLWLGMLLYCFIWFPYRLRRDSRNGQVTKSEFIPEHYPEGFLAYILNGNNTSAHFFADCIATFISNKSVLEEKNAALHIRWGGTPESLPVMKHDFVLAMQNNLFPRSRDINISGQEFEPLMELRRQVSTMYKNSASRFLIPGSVSLLLGYLCTLAMACWLGVTSEQGLGFVLFFLYIFVIPFILVIFSMLNNNNPRHEKFRLNMLIIPLLISGPFTAFALYFINNDNFILPPGSVYISFVCALMGSYFQTYQTTHTDEGKRILPVIEAYFASQYYSLHCYKPNSPKTQFPNIETLLPYAISHLYLKSWSQTVEKLMRNKSDKPYWVQQYQYAKVERYKHFFDEALSSKPDSNIVDTDFGGSD